MFNSKKKMDMKKLILSMLLAVMGITASAQFYAGGSVNLSRNWEDNKSHFSIQPEVGYNISDKWAAGLGIGYAHHYANSIKVNAFEINPYARYTACKFGALSFFVDGGLDFVTFKAKVGDGPSSDAYNAWQVGLKPGLKVSLCKNIDFIAHMGFLGYRDNDDFDANAGIENPVKYGDKGFKFSCSTEDLSFGVLFNF